MYVGSKKKLEILIANKCPEPKQKRRVEIPIGSIRTVEKGYKGSPIAKKIHLLLECIGPGFVEWNAAAKNPSVLKFQNIFNSFILIKESKANLCGKKA